MTKSKIIIGDRVKSIREELNLSQNDLASKLGVPQSKISKIENNELKANIINVLIDFCKIAGISLDEFFNCSKEEIILSGEIKLLVDRAKKLDKDQLKTLVSFLDTLIGK
jgi:Uncharacterized protein conserved in bacteria